MPDPNPTFIPKARTAFPTRVAAVGGEWLMSVGIAAFIAALAFGGGLWFYQRTLRAAHATWTQQVAAQEAELRPDLLAQLTDLARSLDVARELLSQHVFASNTLRFIETLTHPAVRFRSMSFSRDARRLDLAGEARSYQTVADQVRAIEAHPQTEKVDFGGLSRDEQGRVSFKLAVVFKPSLLGVPSQ